MRRGIFSHRVYIDATNTDQLQSMNFVFLCFDAGKAKDLAVEALEKFGPFVDVGRGIYLSGDSLGGTVKPRRARWASTSTAECRLG